MAGVASRGQWQAGRWVGRGQGDLSASRPYIWALGISIYPPKSRGQRPAERGMRVTAISPSVTFTTHAALSPLGHLSLVDLEDRSLRAIPSPGQGSCFTPRCC